MLHLHPAYLLHFVDLLWVIFYDNTNNFFRIIYSGLLIVFLKDLDWLKSPHMVSLFCVGILLYNLKNFSSMQQFNKKKFWYNYMKYVSKELANYWRNFKAMHAKSCFWPLHQSWITTTSQQISISLLLTYSLPLQAINYAQLQTFINPMVHDLYAS